MSSSLENLLGRHLAAGTIPGAVALRAPADGEPELVAVGAAALGGAPMRADAIMRIQSMIKAILLTQVELGERMWGLLSEFQEIS